MNLLPNFGRIAFYLRLSLADGDLNSSDKAESNSIENQRGLLQEYVRKIITNAYGEEYDEEYLEILVNEYLKTVEEYIDDGYTGTNFERPAFKRMIEAAKRKEINTIIVKDTSRLGRDYIEVGDYMEQIFPLLGIRFIAVNSYYDSDNYKNTTLGLETSIINLVNSEYSKDLSRKIKSSRQAMWSKGIPTCGKAPFGYITENKRYVIDKETAPIVRFVFEKAISGYGTKAIANLLNADSVPPPGVFYERRTGKPPSIRVVADEEYIWDTWMIYRILKNYSYTGSMVQGKYQSFKVGSRGKRKADREDWIILENTHDAIVSVSEWEAAQLVIKSTSKREIRLSTDYVLLGKIRCGTCGLLMQYKELTSNIFCSHGHSAGIKSKCCRAHHDAAKLVSLVAFELHRQMELLEHLSLKIEESKSGNTELVSLETLRKQTTTELEILKAEKVRQYEAYAEGIIDRNEYIRKKDEIAEKTKKLEDRLKEAEEVTLHENELLSDIHNIQKKYDAQRKSGTALTRKMVLAMIDCIIIYDEQTIEIKFTFDDIGRRAVEYLNENNITL